MDSESEWTEERLRGLIRDAVEEGLVLDYKAADALGTSEKKKSEITKDVSALANAAGGTIIYGIKEFDDVSRRHRPEKIDPVDRAVFSKEWLEHVIGNISPRIDGLRISPVTLDPSLENRAVYVVEVPQGRTAHQARDLRYYRRYNFESVPMRDHEIRDVLGRSQHPQIEMEFDLVRTPRLGARIVPGGVSLRVTYRNVGQLYAGYINGFVSVPISIAGDDLDHEEYAAEMNGEPYKELSFANLQRDLVAYEPGLPSISAIDGAKFGPS